MDKLEKIIWIVTGLAVLCVIALAAIGPIKSEISDRTVQDDFDKLNPHLKARRQRAQPEVPGRVPPTGSPSFPANPRGTRPATPTVKPVPGQPTQPGGTPAPQPPYNPGITVGEPEPVIIPQSMVQKYQHFEDIVDLGMTAYGEDVPMPDGSVAFQMHEIAEDSPLSTRLGFMPGDIIISVNGYPASKGNSRQLYDTLKNERAFVVAIKRQGQDMTLRFNLQ